MKDNIVQQKSYEFALQIVRTYKHMVDDQKEYTLFKQLLRSGTSIGANIEEGIGAQSRKDFIHKLSISYKEARETRYWLRLLNDSDYLDDERVKPLLEACEELLRILGSIIKTSKSK